jgi:hypothetical protein
MMKSCSHLAPKRVISTPNQGRFYFNQLVFISNKVYCALIRKEVPELVSSADFIVKEFILPANNDIILSDYKVFGMMLHTVQDLG